MENRRARCKSCFLGLLGFSVPLLLLFALVLGSLSREVLELALGSEGTDTLSLYLVSMYISTCFFHLKRNSEVFQCVWLLFIYWFVCFFVVPPPSSLQAPVVKAFDSLSVETQLYVCGGLVLLSFILLILARFSSRLVRLCALRLSQQISRFECYLKSPCSSFSP